MQKIKQDSPIPALLFSKGLLSSSPQAAMGPTKPVPPVGPHPRLASAHPYSPVRPKFLSAELLLIQPLQLLVGWYPRPGSTSSPGRCPMPQGEATQEPGRQGALTTPGATTTGNLQHTGHPGRFNQREKQKISLKPPAAVCTRNTSNSLSKRTKQQTGSKGCAYSSLLQIFQLYKDRGRENKGIKQTKLIFTCF